MDGYFCVPEHDPEMGTAAWGRRSGTHGQGRLSRLEKLKVLVNLGRITALEGADVLLNRTRLLNAYGTDLDGLEPPDTALVRDAFDLADDVQSLELMRHSWRTYYWAMLLGGYRNLKIDREILFAAAILHDIGLARDRTSKPSDCCFAVYGAERCKQHLVGLGHDRAKVRQIADAIGLHLNAYVSRKLHGTEAHLLSRGAMCDVFGIGRHRIAKAVRKQVFTEQPKGNLMDELEIWPDHHLADTRADFLIRLEGRHKRKTGSRLLIQPGG